MSMLVRPLHLSFFVFNPVENAGFASKRKHFMIASGFAGHRNAAKGCSFGKKQARQSETL